MIPNKLVHNFNLFRPRVKCQNLDEVYGPSVVAPNRESSEINSITI